MVSKQFDQRVYRCVLTLLVCTLACHSLTVTAFAQRSAQFTSVDGADVPTPPNFADSTIRRRRPESWFAMPTVRVQLSTPSAYLRGWRDDYTSTNHAAYFSEYTFTLFSDSKERLRLQSDATTDAAAKPFLENQGVQLFMTHELPLQRLTTTVFNADIDLGQAKLSYGVRYQSTSDSFYWSPTSFYLDQFETATEATNHFLGPQVALNWSKQHFGSNFEIGSKLMVGQSLLDANQRGSYGTSFVPAGLDHSVIDQTHRFSNSIEHDINTTVGEVRASVTYPLLEDLSLRAGYIGIYFADMRWAQDMQRWRLPDMGIDSTQSSDFWSDQFYASIEWRR